VTGEKQLARLGSPRRLRTIYNANMRSARAAGHWADIQRGKRLQPYLLYELGPSENHRPEHVAKEGIILPVDDPFWLVWFPPNGWGCKCRVRQITRAEAERRGGVTERPNDVMREWINSRTGEVKQIPRGIDPGWERNPAILREDHMTRFLTGKLDTVDPDIAKTMAADMIDSWRFRRVLDGSAPGSVPIAVTPRAVKTALETKNRTVTFAAERSEKMRSKHSEASPDRFSLVQAALDRGVFVQDGKRSLVGFVEDQEGKWWRLVLWRDPSGGIRLETLHRSSARQMRRILRDREVISPGE